MGRSPNRLVVGLGNPGPRYRGTRHNVGFEVVEGLAAREGTLFQSPRLLAEPPASLEAFEDTEDVEALVARTRGGGALLAMPTTFMNLSGEAVLPLVRLLGLAPEEVLVVYDDMDLPVGALRIRPHGGAGGQKGMASIIELLGTDRFPRLRVGIGRAETDAARHVLSVFPPEERRRIDASIAEAVDAIRFWLDGSSIDACMTRFQSRWNRGPEGPAPSKENHDTNL